MVLALPKTSQQNMVRIFLSTSDILSAVHLTLTNMCHQTHEIRVSAVFVQVKNGWSYPSVPPIRLHGVRTRLLDLLIFNEVLQVDSAVSIVTKPWTGRKEIVIRLLANAREFLFSTAYRRALRPTQPPIKLVRRNLP